MVEEEPVNHAATTATLIHILDKHNLAMPLLSQHSKLVLLLVLPIRTLLMAATRTTPKCGMQL